MNYESLHNYFRDILTSEYFPESVRFVHAEPAMFQFADKDTAIAMFSLPFTSNGVTDPNLSELYTCAFICAKQDRPDGGWDENEQQSYTVGILAETNKVVDSFIRLVDYNKISDDLEYHSDLIDIVAFRKGNVIRENEVLTGTTLELDIRVSDSFCYCCDAIFGENV